MGLAFPVMLLLMFTYLVGGGRGVDGDPTEFLVPGMLALTMAFGLESTMFAVTQDLNKGVIDRSAPCRWSRRGSWSAGAPRTCSSRWPRSP